MIKLVHDVGVDDEEKDMKNVEKCDTRKSSKKYYRKMSPTEKN